MKKIFCAVLALAAMASCSKEYIVAENKQVIGFGEAFVDNGTRADYSQLDKPVEAFKVYGTLTGSYGNTVQIFNGDDVTKPTENYFNGGVYDSTKAWLCTETQYWVPNATYQFAAIVDGVAETTTTLPEEIKFTVADGANNKDLLYATATASVDNDGVVTTGTNASGSVAFSFNHLLSKLQFTIDSSNIGAGYSIKVTGITVEGVAEKGIYNVAGGTWAQDGSTTTTLTFGSEGAYETRQILPVEQTLAVTIAYDIYFGDTATGTKISNATKSGTIAARGYDKKTVYNITAAIELNSEIKFTVEAVNGWANGGDINLM